MTKCDLTYDELVEQLEEAASNQKANAVLMSIMTGLCVGAVAWWLGKLAIIGAIACCEFHGMPATVTQFAIASVVIGAAIVVTYIFYHVCTTIIYRYVDEIETFFGRWKRFKEYERAEQQFEKEDAE